MFEPLRAFLLLMLLLGCALTGCGSGSADSGIPINDRNSIVGTWTARSITNGTTTQACPATLNDPPNATVTYGPVSCTGTETFVFYKDSKCRINGSDPIYMYSAAAGATVGTIQFEASHCPPSNLEIPCVAFHGVVDLSHNTLTVRQLHSDNTFVDVIYLRVFAGG